METIMEKTSREDFVAHMTTADVIVREVEDGFILSFADEYQTYTDEYGEKQGLYPERFLAGDKGPFVQGAQWNARENRYEIKQPNQVVWGRTIEALAREFPERAYATLDKAKAAYVRRLKKA
jgi:hypothetical protein